MKRYFLGMAAGYSEREVWRHTFAVGFRRDCRELKGYLRKHYGGGNDSQVVLCKNGRSALCLALKAYFQPGDAVIVNGFTCYAVYEAVKAAGLVPIWVDISHKDLNFDPKTIEGIFRAGPATAFPPFSSSSMGGPQAVSPARVKGLIIQNSLGNAIDIKKIEGLAKKHGLTIIEDLAHSVGVKYADGREAGTVGAAAVFSFGKDKSIDTVSGGAVVLRGQAFVETEGFRSAAAREGAREPRGDGRERRGPRFDKSLPYLPPKPSDHLRARFYPLFGLICRRLTGIHLGGMLMRGLLAIHWVERSADNKLDLERKMSKFEAKLALKQFRELRRKGAHGPIRDFCLVRDRGEVLKKLKQAGYYFDGFWYEKPVSPKRYYKKVHFPEAECPNAVFIAEHIVNLPTYYSKADLAPALKIIKPYLIENEQKGGKRE